MRRSLCLLLFLTTSLAAVAPAAADTELERRSAFAQGRRAMEAERWDEALVIYQRLWAERRTFDIALQLGLVEFNLRKYRDAAEHLSFGIRTLPPKEAQATAERAKKLLALAEREVAKLEILVNRDNAEVRIDGVPIGRSPLEVEAYVEPGSHRIEAALEPHAPVEKLVQVNAAERQQISLELAAPLGNNPEPTAISAVAPQPDLTPLPAPPPSNREPSGRKNMLPVYLAGGVAAVGIGVGVSLLVIAGGKDSDKDQALARLPGTQPCARNTPHARECESIQNLASDARTFRTAGVVAVGAGVLAAGTAVALLVWPERDVSAGAPVRERAPRFALLPRLGLRESGASLVGEF